jgi:hypothetical protein
MWPSCLRWCSGMRIPLGASVQRWLYLGAAQLRHWAEASSGHLKKEESVQNKVWDFRHPQWRITTLCEQNELWKPKHYHLCKSSWHQACMNYESTLCYHQQKAICPSVVIPWQKAELLKYNIKYMLQLDTTLCSVNINVRITTVQFPLQVFVFMVATLTSIYNFQVRHPQCVEYKLKFNIIQLRHNFINPDLDSWTEHFVVSL